MFLYCLLNGLFVCLHFSCQLGHILSLRYAGKFVHFSGNVFLTTNLLQLYLYYSPMQSVAKFNFVFFSSGQSLLQVRAFASKNCYLVSAGSVVFLKQNNVNDGSMGTFDRKRSNWNDQRPRFLHFHIIYLFSIVVSLWLLDTVNE